MRKLISVLCGVCLAWAFQGTAQAQTITNQPLSITVNNASTATFTVGATNALAYQWQFNGTNLSDGGNITGSTTSALTLEDVMTNQNEGSYTVIVSATNTSVTSSPPAVLTIVPGTIVRFTFSGLLPGASGSNVDVQLFDHDKPVTVQNFIHYIRGGGYSNMFFERLEAGFVLQGGIFGASDRTNTTPPLTGWEILNKFIMATNLVPPYPQQIESEFNVGPLIHNRFGTVAMALSDNQNSANSSFFFNLADNSANLDFQQGGFTVFGRILDGTNVLQYFNTLADGNGIVTSGQIFTNGSLDTSGTQQISELPVNYIGTNAPANANLVFCDFNFLTTPFVDTNPPTVAITNPAPNALLTNSLAGTAQDDVGVADVICVLTPQGIDGIYPYPYTNAIPETNEAVGTTNWSVGLNPGVYGVSVQSQDGAGNLSAPITEVITNTAIVVIGNGSVVFTNAELTNANPVGYPFQPYSNYGVQAIPGPNQTFVGWSDGTSTTSNPTNAFTYLGSVYVATFISNTSNGIAFTFPTNNATLSNTLFDITGTISTSVLTLPVTVTCQIFTNGGSNYAATLPLSTTTSATNWSVDVTNYLPTGSYTIQALATDHSGSNTLITENFNFIANTNPPVVAITSPAPNAVLYLGGPMIIQGTAGGSIVPLASVSVTFVPLTNADGTVPDYGVSFTNAAIGTTNWSLDLGTLGYIPPGMYTLEAQAEDAAGSLSPASSQPLTLSAILIDGDGTVTLTQGTNNKGNPIGYPLQYGVTYGVHATAVAGNSFVNWTYQSNIVPNNPWTNFDYTGGQLTATFIPSNTPIRGMSFTNPRANQRLQTNSFLLKGTIAASVGLAQITCQISSLSTGLAVGLPLTTSGTKTWSVAVSNLPPDDYLVQAVGTNARGFSTVISEAFAVLAFKGVAGTYNGLFLCTTEPVASTNSGLITLTLADSGSFSAKLCFPAYAPVPIASYFFADGVMYFPYQVFQDNPLRINMLLDLTNGTETMTGTISSRTWSSQIVLNRAATKLSTHTTPATGKYVLSLDPANWPNTNGYASLSVSAGGSLALSGALPDGAAFSQSAKVSTNGVWPLYAIPSGYKTNGMFLGWETNLASGYSSGPLYWSKASNVGTYYTSGVDVNVNSTGTNYISPAAGNYSIVFQGGTITVPVTNQLTVARAGAQFKPASSNDKLAISLSAAGVLTGHFVNPNGNKTLQFKGAFLGQSQGGSGFILDGGTQTGQFLLEAQ
jgi:cyclophilin family peptidyl-prolyl cis-trans isomerase